MKGVSEIIKYKTTARLEHYVKNEQIYFDVKVFSKTVEMYIRDNKSEDRNRISIIMDHDKYKEFIDAISSLKPKYIPAVIKKYTYQRDPAYDNLPAIMSDEEAWEIVKMYDCRHIAYVIRIGRLIQSKLFQCIGVTIEEFHSWQKETCLYLLNNDGYRLYGAGIKTKQEYIEWINEIMYLTKRGWIYNGREK